MPPGSFPMALGLYGLFVAHDGAPSHGRLQCRPPRWRQRWHCGIRRRQRRQSVVPRCRRRINQAWTVVCEQVGTHIECANVFVLLPETHGPATTETPRAWPFLMIPG